MESKLFIKENLQKCSSKIEVEKYFKLINISEEDYKTKIQALTEACNSKEIKYFAESSLKKQYEDILAMFLDEDIRIYRGIGI